MSRASTIAELKQQLQHNEPDPVELWYTDPAPQPVPAHPPVHTGGYPIDDEAYWAAEASHLQGLSGEDPQTV